KSMATTSLHEVLEAGVEEGASDWHIRENQNISVRIQGRLGEFEFSPDRDFFDNLFGELLSKKQLEFFQEQGDVDFAFREDGVGRFRANLHRQRGFFSLTLRYVQDIVPQLEELNLPAKIHELAESRRGIVFVCGRTGAGKSTTLARMIEHVNEVKDKHIISIEDPIEFSFQDKHSVIEQREVGIDTISFDSALVHVMRQDPDVIVIGEMRDRTSFETAISAAETGHLVFSTLHTTSASQALIRLTDMYPQEERESVRRSLAESVQGVVCQELVTRADGKGLVPAVEVMVKTPIVEKLITNAQFEKLEQAIDGGTKEGMISFNQSLYELVQKGLVNKEHALAVAHNPEALKMLLKGIRLNTADGQILDG
ncbi:MAG: type IV pilus twitching motility protein PilT, partial [Lentisphaeria bacterium]